MISRSVSKFLFSSGSTANAAYIVAGKRTPIASFMGKLSKLRGPELGSIAIRGALESVKLDAKEVDEVLLGNVCSAGQG
jgi:acetyl-CoA C-acetyltransferase